MDIQELCTRFTADLSDFNAKMKAFREDLVKVSGVTSDTSKKISEALSSPSEQIRKMGKEMSNLADKQIKTAEKVADMKHKLEDYKTVLAAIQQKHKEQREEMQKLIDKFHKLTAVQKKQQAFLDRTDGGIERVRKAHQNLIDYIHHMSDEYEKLNKESHKFGQTPNDSVVKELESIMLKIQQTKTELADFDKQLSEIGINPEKLNTSKFTTVNKEIEELRNKMGNLEHSELDLIAKEESLNSVITNTAVKIENLKDKLNTGSEALVTMRKRLKSMSEQANGTKSIFSKLGSGISSIAKLGFNSLIKRIKGASSSANGLSNKLLNVTKSIKRIGIVSLGLKVVKSVFGQLRSVVSNYLSSNEKLNAKVEALKNSLGKALAPAIEVIVGLFEKLMPYVVSVANAISDLLSSLGITAALKSTSSALDGVTDSTKELSKSQKDLYGFDQITKVSDNSSSDSSSSNEDISVSQKLTEYLQKLKDLWNNSDFEGVGSAIAGSLNKVLSKINSLDWNGIQDKVNNFVSGIVGSLNGFIKNFDWNGAADVLSNGINTLLGGLYTAVSTFDWSNAGSSLASGINRLVQKIDWEKAGKLLSDAVKGLLDLLVKLIENTDWRELGRKLAVLIKSIDWSGIVKSLSEGLGAALAGLTALICGLLEDAWNGVVNWWHDVAYKDGKFTIDGLRKGIVDALVNIGKWINDYIFKPFIDGFKKAFGIHSPAKEMMEPGKQIWNGVLEGITNAISNIKDWVQKNILDKVQNAIDSGKQLILSIGAKLSDTFTKAKEKWDSLKDKTITLTNNVKESVQNALNTLKTKYDSLKDKKVTLTNSVKESTANALSNLKKNWDSLKDKKITLTNTVKESTKNAVTNLKKNWDAFKNKTVTITANVKDNASSVFKNIANKFIDFVNKAINKINSKLKISISSTLAKILKGLGISVSGGSYQLFSIPTIPKLETGGIISKPTIAMVGEHGKEAVMPLENNTGWITQLAHTIVSIMGSRGEGNQGPIIIPIYIGGKHITDVVIDDINKRTKSSGNCPIKV